MDTIFQQILSNWLIVLFTGLALIISFRSLTISKEALDMKMAINAPNLRLDRALLVHDLYKLSDVTIGSYMPIDIPPRSVTLGVREVRHMPGVPGKIS